MHLPCYSLDLKHPPKAVMLRDWLSAMALLGSTFCIEGQMETLALLLSPLSSWRHPLGEQSSFLM